MIKNSLNLHFMFAKDSKKIGALKMRKILIPFLLLALSLSFYACKKEVLGTIESMGIIHEVLSPAKGVLIEVNVKNEDIVEYEQVLFQLKEEK